MSSLTPSSEPEDQIVLNTLPNEPDLNARLGYEPEGASCCSDSCSSDTTLKRSKTSKWSNNLHSLLNSKNGLKSFQRYLEKTNVNHFHMLRFLFACKGLSEETLDNAQILIKVIYTRFIAENRIEIDSELRDKVSEQIEQATKSGRPLSRDIFKDICARIEQIINEEMYPEFLAHQAQKLQNAKCPIRSHHDCKKHFFEHCQSDHCRSAHCHCKSTDHSKRLEPETLAKDLMQRLEKVKLNEESENYKAKEYKQSAGINSLKGILARVISQKVEGDEDDTEYILDNHMNRVWTDDNQDTTNTSASHKYIDSKKYVHVPHPYMGSGSARKKSKDAYSMFSSDSGFGTGYYSDEVSKRASDYSSYDSDYVPGGRNQVRADKWSASRQTLTDSGASMMSEDEDRYFRMSHNEKMYGHKPAHFEGGGESALYNKRRNMMPTQGHTRDPFKFINEIPSVSMNSLHSVDSYAQLEEDRRCLLRNEMKKILKSPSWGGNSQQNQNFPSMNLKTNLKSNSFSKYDDSTSTTVVYNFSDEKMPYRVRVPGTHITLKDFKRFMPKKGNYRYFFITPCEDFGMRAVQEEVTDDSQILPLWEGKVDARIKAIK